MVEKTTIRTYICMLIVCVLYSLHKTVLSCLNTFFLNPFILHCLEIGTKSKLTPQDARRYIGLRAGFEPARLPAC